MAYQIMKETGLSWHEIHWKVSHANLMLMMADRPNFKKGEEVAVPDSGSNLARRFKQRKSS
jgi:hypothetical protein